MPRTNNRFNRRRRGAQHGRVIPAPGNQIGTRPRGKGLDTDTTIDFVIDFSASMRSILGAVYLMCHDIMDYAQSGNAKVQFGLTVFGNMPEPFAAAFNDQPFTGMGTDIEEKMLTALVGGGARNGDEAMGAAVKASLEKMQNAHVPAGNRVLVLFTDSALRNDKVMANIRSLDLQTRAAVFFVSENETNFGYDIPLVDAEGNPSRIKTPHVFDIHDIVSERQMKTADADGGETYRQLIANQMMLAMQ